MSEFIVIGRDNNFQIKNHCNSLDLKIGYGYVDINFIDVANDEHYSQEMHFNSNDGKLITLLTNILLQLKLRSFKYDYILEQFIRDFLQSIGENVYFEKYINTVDCNQVIKFYDSNFDDGLRFYKLVPNDGYLTYTIEKSICRSHLRINIDVLNNTFDKISEITHTYYCSQPIGKLNIDNVLELLKLTNEVDQEKFLITLSEK